ncbi:YoaK family protein [Paratractidigestivibacter sp.]|uniref:YoaK family protein n=1 Tax=Paratractidigestivibacter sp. TaxID=2847316 RepID=UPI002AC9A4E3|nr:YoaK family protein [Paratractidigestivibacter sp.]
MIRRAKQESESLEIASLLALAGGIMDAYSYLVRDHVFANAQTGNMLLFGIHLSAGHWIECLHYGVPVACFAAGIALCHTIKLSTKEERFHWRQLALAIEAAFLVIVAFIPAGRSLWANGLTSFACGIQVQAFRKFHGRPLATTMCIGNLRSGTQSLVSWVNEGNPASLRHCLLSFYVIVCFVIGAVVGNWVRPALGIRTILLSAALLAVAFLVMFVDRESPEA